MVAATSLLLALIGAILTAAGTYLITLGGSPYYAITGLVFLTAAFLLWRRSGWSLALYAALIAGTLIWAIAEVGFDWWRLGPRGGVIVLIGLWLLLPVFARRLQPAAGPRMALAASVVAAIVVAVMSMFSDPHDIAGRLNEQPVAAADAADGAPASDWPAYGRTLKGERYAPLSQITPANVGNLAVAWTYQTGDVRGKDDIVETTYQVTPLKIGDTLYLCTPHHIAIALDAASGTERWRYDPRIPLENQRQHQTCRGISYYADPAITSGAPCATRVYLPTADARLIALDAATGQICPSFGNGGTVDLTAGMPYKQKGYYYSTSPPVIAAGLVILGGAVNDNYALHEPSGVIRAFDAATGALVWNWDSGNPDRTTPLAPGETYTANSPNSWSISSADEALGLIYIPLGNATPDQLGMGRSANVERFSSSIVALDIKTGALRWVRQTVHHDLWDMDVPSQPSLVDLMTPAGIVPALVGPTKQGDIYVLDRRTGEPILPVTEVPAPGGAIPEDFSSPTQPLSSFSFNPPALGESDMWGITMFDELACRIAFRKLRYEGRYTPPSLQGTLVYPGNFGVFNWGGVAIDPVRQVMVGMPTTLAFTSRLVPAADIPPADSATKGSEQGLNRNDGAAYGVVMGPFLSPLGIPCQAPPWGTIAGADLRTGTLAWRHKNGTTEDMTPLPLKFRLGVPGIGGPMITAGGLVFMGAAVDNYLRAYDETTGAQLWEARLPAGGQATPMSYEAGGKQYVLIVAGGHGSIGTKAGDYVIAYKLPD